MELLSEIWDKTTDAFTAFSEGVSEGLVRLFGSSNERKIRQMRPMVAQDQRARAGDEGALRANELQGQDRSSCGVDAPTGNRSTTCWPRHSRRPRVGPPLSQHAALRRPVDGRIRPARRQYRRDGHRRRQDAGRHAGRLSQRARRPRRPRRDGQRLPGPPRRRMDEPAVSRPGHDRRRHPVGDGLRPSARRSTAATSPTAPTTSSASTTSATT